MTSIHADEKQLKQSGTRLPRTPQATRRESGARSDHLLESSSLLHERGDFVADRDDHVAMRDEPGTIHRRAVARDHFGVWAAESDSLS